jgi:hypothetical protein
MPERTVFAGLQRSSLAVRSAAASNPAGNLRTPSG